MDHEFRLRRSKDDLSPMQYILDKTTNFKKKKAYLDKDYKRGISTPTKTPLSGRSQKFGRAKSEYATPSMTPSEISRV